MEEKKSLFDEFRTSDEMYCYYGDIDNPFGNTSLEFNESAKKYISDYFVSGQKEMAFSINFEDEYKKNGKHEHTVALYFLGCYMHKLLHDIVGKMIKTYVSKHVERSNAWYSFFYTWFLTCLYHDTASCIERSKFQQKGLSFFLGDNDVHYNVYEHSPVRKRSKLLTYPESLVQNYFDYRIDYGNVVEHGILGGYILFDRLRKNYDAKWNEENEKKKESGQNENAPKYEDFTSEVNGKTRSFRIEHLDHFALIADSIIAHNIWYGQDEDKKIYEHYGLSPLIASKDNKIRFSENPLLFYLSLLDTIEPVKCIQRKQSEKRKKIMSAIDILKSIDVEADNTKGIITITILDCDNDTLLYNAWFDDIKKMPSWIDVKIAEGSESRQITIQIVQ